MIASAIRRPLLADAALSRLMDVLTGGSFLAGLGLLAGASNFGLGILAALPFLAQVVQLPTVALLLRWPDRRRIVVWCAGASRALLVAVALLLFVAPARLSTALLVAILGLSAILTVVATAAWNWWMRDLLPADEMGRFFSRRMRGATLVSMLAMLVAGAALDAFVQDNHAPYGYGLLFGIGGLAGLAAVVALARTPHSPPPPSPPARDSLRLLKRALQEAPKGLVTTLSLTAVSAAFALPFLAVFLLRGLGFSFLAVTSMAVVSQAAYLGGLRAWGYLSDRHGDRAVLAVTLGILGACLFGWAAAGWPTGWPLLAWIAALHFLAGFALGGIELSGTNLLLRSAPTNNAAGHLAAVSFVRAAAAGTGVLLAGALWQALGPDTLWSMNLGPLGAWHLRGFQALCIVALVPTGAALAAVARLPSPRPEPIIEVARSMRREVHHMSSVAGIRGLIHAVSYSVELFAWPFAARPGKTPKPKHR